MNFNSDSNKHVQQVIFNKKVNKINHPLLLFNQNLFKPSSTQKHLGMVLNTKLHFNLHLQNVQWKVNKTIGLHCQLENILPRDSLVTIYKSFIRPYLGYKETPKIFPKFVWNIRFLKTPFVSQLHMNGTIWTQKSATLTVLLWNITNFIRPKRNGYYHCHNPGGIKLITMFHLGLSHPRKHKFKHSFHDSLNSPGLIGNDTESLAISYFTVSSFQTKELPFWTKC